VPASGRRAAQGGWNPQEPFQTEKAAKHGKMIKHGPFAEIASRLMLPPGCFHTTKTRSGRCYGATQAGNPGVRRFLDRLRIASVANGNKNWLSGQPLQVVKWIADLFPLFAGVV
jgi:hypothetical protein